MFNRTQGNPALTVVKSSAASNCVIPTATAAQFVAASNLTANPFLLLGACTANVTFNPAAVNPVIPGTAAVAVGSSNGIPALGIAPYLISDGVQVALQGNRLRTCRTSPVVRRPVHLEPERHLVADGAGRLFLSGSTYARIYNSAADKLKSWSNVNITATLASTDGWTIDAYVKNATDEKAITGTYLTDDSSGLFRNAFYTEPRTIGLGIAKAFLNPLAREWVRRPPETGAVVFSRCQRARRYALQDRGIRAHADYFPQVSLLTFGIKGLSGPIRG